MIEADAPGLPPPFEDTLAAHGVALTRSRAATLQVNVGRRCNLQCRHCHLEAGPDRAEIMPGPVLGAVADFAARNRFTCVDVTGGAPELHPGIGPFLERLAPLAPRLVLRTNLAALAADRTGLLERCARLGVALAASLPSTNAAQADAQRGPGVWERSVAALRALNAAGYGVPGSGLELDLVANPAGAFLPPEQCALERRYRRELERLAGVGFTRLLAFGNVPLGRFAGWLRSGGGYERYLRLLAERFNPQAVGGLMCRTLVSVDWDGTLRDCDFNIAAGLDLGAGPASVLDAAGPPPEGAPVATGMHCYACAAGSGFT